MATALNRSSDPSIQAVLDSLANQLRKRGIAKAGGGASKGTLRVTEEFGVDRVVQVYWTPFQASVPGRCVVLNLEVAEPRLHWAEAYLSGEYRCWVFFFAEREDGQAQLLYYFQADSPQAAVEGFFDHAAWYILTATDKTWGDVTYEVASELPWDDAHDAQVAAPMSTALDEALKKGTIAWIRYRHDGSEVTQPVWFLYDQKAGKVYVLSGERTQDLPGAERMRECDLVLRWKGKNAAVAEVPASVRVIDGSDPGWTEVADKVAEKRLNIPGLPEETASRWRDECVILELTLRG